MRQIRLSYRQRPRGTPPRVAATASRMFLVGEPISRRDPRNRRPPLRVCPGTLGGVAELSQHQADGSETQKGKRLAVEIFPILGQPAAAVEPGEGALDNPAFG